MSHEIPEKFQFCMNYQIETRTPESLWHWALPGRNSLHCVVFTCGKDHAVLVSLWQYSGTTLYRPGWNKWKFSILLVYLSSFFRVSTSAQILQRKSFSVWRNTGNFVAVLFVLFLFCFVSLPFIFALQWCWKSQTLQRLDSTFKWLCKSVENTS